MKFDFRLVAELLTLFWPFIEKAIDKIKSSTTVDDKAKDLFIMFADYGDQVIKKTKEAIELAEQNRNPVTDGIVFKFGRVLKSFVVRAQNLVNYIETKFGVIDLDPSKY